MFNGAARIREPPWIPGAVHGASLKGLL
jgi:hypothetical protein